MQDPQLECPNPPTSHCGCLWANLEMRRSTLPRPASFRSRSIERRVTHDNRFWTHTTASGHTSAISARKVIDTDVFDASGKKIGEVKDVVLDKTSNNIMFAVVGFGGLMGVGEKYHPIPWSELDYSELDYKEGRTPRTMGAPIAIGLLTTTRFVRIGSIDRRSGAEPVPCSRRHRQISAC